MNRGQQLYTADKAANIIGGSRRQVLAWLEGGYVAPDFTAGEGPGARRSLSFLNLVELGIVKALLEKGLRPGTVKKLMAALYRDRPLAGYYHPWKFKEGMDGLAGGGLSKESYRVKGDGTEEKIIHQPGAPHCGCIFWAKGHLHTLEPYQDGKGSGVRPADWEPEPTLQVVVVAQLYLQDVKLTRVFRWFQEVAEPDKAPWPSIEFVFALDLGRIEKAIYEATAE